MEITIRFAGISVESLFKKPRLYKDALCDDLAQKCLEAFSSYGLGAQQIAVRVGDLAFNYDLSFMLFNGNGSFKISPEKLEVHFKNIVADRDVEVVTDCIAKLYERVPLPEINGTDINANAQGAASSVETAREYLLRYGNPSKGVTHGGAIAYMICDNWPKEIRLMVDRSMFIPEGIYLMWSTSFDGQKISPDVVESLTGAFEQAASRLDLTFLKARPQ